MRMVLKKKNVIMCEIQHVPEKRIERLFVKLCGQALWKRERESSNNESCGQALANEHGHVAAHSCSSDRARGRPGLGEPQSFCKKVLVILRN
jgi:hypothetical protein